MEFEKNIKKIKDEHLKTHIKKQIAKIVKSPATGKPMKFQRKGTREVYVSPFRLSYGYLTDENKIIFLDFYHKDQQ